MAKSPSHEFGQIIGFILEKTVSSILTNCAEKHNLYLDKQGKRTARKGKKVSWVDKYGNNHDLDFVLEHGGSDQNIGKPVAFIESAWRRYTKHSRNKAQEIQGALLPIIAANSMRAPFKGVILAGVFTQGALEQLESVGFCVLYFRYETVIEAFKNVQIDASFDEDTPDSEFSKKLQQWKKLSSQDQDLVIDSLIKINGSGIRRFLDELEYAITRRIKFIRILPLHGVESVLQSIEDAISFVETYHQNSKEVPLKKYEIKVEYSNGDKIEAEFIEKTGLLQFLRKQIR